MSDFDKEAEREKLREKYERDQQKRKETERMSQLLLQGATMTNRHCDTCGDPLFRYQGTQFCATCEGRKQEAEASSGTQPESQLQPESQTQASSGTRDAGQETDAAKPTRPTDGQSETVPTGDAEGQASIDADAAGGTATGDDAEPTPGTRDTSAPTVEADTAAVEADAPESHTGTDRPIDDPSRAETPARTTRDTHGGDDADLDAARASLIRTLTHHARRAEAVEDPRRATDHLTAVREAAEALSALGGSR